MTTFKNYLAHRLKETGLTTLVFSLISAIITLSVTIESASYYLTYGDYIEYKGETGIYILAIILGIFCTVIPLLETAGFKNRRNLDTLCFLPISRFKLALAHYVSGFIQIIVIYTVSFVTSAFCLISYAEHFVLAYLPLYYILSLLIGLVIYSCFIFIFGKANTVVDGVIFCALWLCALWLITGVVFMILEAYLDGAFSVEIEPGELGIIPQMEGLYDFCEYMIDLSEWLIVYVPLNDCTVVFQYLMENPGNEYYMGQFERIISEAYMFAFWGAVGLASAYGYFKHFVRYKVESAGEISNSAFGYKLLIPIYGYCCLVAIGDGLSFNIMFWAMMIVGYAIYRRGMKFKKSDITSLAVGLIFVCLPGIDFICLLLLLGTPIFSVIWLGLGIYRLVKAKRKSVEESVKAETAKQIICIVLSSLLFILSVAAVVVNFVLNYVLRI